MADRASEGRLFRLLNVLDDFAEKGQGAQIDFPLLAEWPAWAKKMGSALTYIQPSQPNQNADAGRLNRMVRNTWLDLYNLDNLKMLQKSATKLLWSQSDKRPILVNGRMTPAQ